MYKHAHFFVLGIVLPLGALAQKDPSPPTNLNIDVIDGQMVTVSWKPPKIGGYSAYNIKVIPLNKELSKNVRNVVITEDHLPYTLEGLIPGGTYELQVYTVYKNKESADYVSYNVTTRPNTPGRLLVWYRNETTMLVLWQPPHPPGIYSHYMVSIYPNDAVNNNVTVEKDGDPPGPAQAPFHGLVPGREYNLTVVTVSGNMISQPTTAAYRTIPLSPRNVTFDPRNITSDSFVVAWQPQKDHGEFDKYSLSIKGISGPPLLKGADEPKEARFFNLEPGHFYTVLVKTISGNVASWPTTGNVTTRPLPVTDIVIEEQTLTGTVLVSWTPRLASKQDSYKIVYQEQYGSSIGTTRISVTSVVTEEFATAELYPGKNYTISVYALSNGIESAQTTKWVSTNTVPKLSDEDEAFLDTSLGKK